MNKTVRYLFLFLFAFTLGTILFSWEKGLFLALLSSIIVFLVRRFIH